LLYRVGKRREWPHSALLCKIADEEGMIESDSTTLPLPS
jgi:hypothetical protein